MNGLIAINKPSGLTSSDVVVRCRGILRRYSGEKIKCGHMGTLDPAAVGVLLVGVGKTARLFDHFLNKKKTYIARISFGKETDTLDSQGSVTNSSDLPNYQDIVNVLPKFCGKIMQIPPQYSAKNVNGVRAYDLARNGQIVDLPSKEVEIFSINIIRSCCLQDKCVSMDIQIECGGGTYIRSLVRDIAYEVGVVAYMSFLIRTACGGYKIENAFTLEEFEKNPNQCICNTKDVISNIMPILEIEDENTRFKIKNGVAVLIETAPKENFGITFDNKIYGIATNDCGMIKIITNLWE